MLENFIIPFYPSFSTLTFSQKLDSIFTKAGVKGSITIYDFKKNQWIYSNSLRAKIGTLPASTFKIIHTLIGLEEKVIAGKHDTIRWDGQPKYFKTFKKEINQKKIG